MKSPASLVRPSVRRLHAYTPGEQPAGRRWIKLNTNENPYPPAPRVMRRIHGVPADRLRRYPHPTAGPLRAALARMHGCEVENVMVGNGSDELLALATRAFVEPAGRPAHNPRPDDASRCLVQYFDPSYSLYPVLADIHNARKNPVKLPADFSLPSPKALEAGGKWDFRAALTFITTPHAPSGRGYGRGALEELVRLHAGVVVLDEAYADFARENALDMALHYPHVLVARTFSKAYSLCFQRIGYFVGHPELIAALDKIRDSYNVNGLGQEAALATLRHLSYYRQHFKTIVAEREKFRNALTGLGFQVFPSEANFLFAKPPGRPAEHWYHALKDRGVLVRWFRDPKVKRFLRITIGTPAEMAHCLRILRRLAASETARSSK